MVKKIIPGKINSHPVVFIYVNGAVFFVAQNVTTGNLYDEKLWKTYGSDAGEGIRKGQSPLNLDIFNGQPGSF